jgi:hypothetical protein
VARAKRTNRAEARRRYRAQLAEQSAEQPEEGADESPEPSRPSKPASGPRAAAQPSGQSQPSGMVYAFRAAFRSPNYREDIAYLPRLVRHPSVWGPVLVTVAAAAAYLATGGRDIISTFAIQYFVAPPPIGAIFIAGFFAPRASYLAGGIVGIASALVLAALTAFAPPSLVNTGGAPGASPTPSISASAGTSGSASLAPSPSTSAAPSAAAAASSSPGTTPAASAAASPEASAAPGTGASSNLSSGQALTYALATSPLSGVFFASAAAWYRRFLRLANPNRGRPAPRQSQRRRR